MNFQDFCFWLHGWYEIQNPVITTPPQLEEIRNHLKLTLNAGAVDLKVPNDWFPWSGTTSVTFFGGNPNQLSGRDWQSQQYCYSSILFTC